ncbi:hypothetical protein [Actinoallomurus sp. CA-150999]|uniref:hypothetical protein n=1 Tax=Actinoallomurus sp. CA-150999 TaxID=3239887 RepID=UPI003D935537
MTFESQAAQAPEDRPRRAPAKARWAIAGLWLEAAIFVLAMVDMFMEAHRKSSHGQSGAGQLTAMGLFFLVIAAFWGAGAVMAGRGARWVRVPAAALQSLFILGGLVTLIVALVAGDPIGIVVAIVYLVVPVGIVWLLLARESRAWMGG